MRRSVGRNVGVALGLSAVASAVVVLPGWASGPGFDNKYGDTTVVRDCGDGDSVTYVGPEKMWPPNHKLQDVAVTARDSDGDDVALEIAGNVTDVAGGDGGSNHDPDVFYPKGPTAMGSGTATVDVQLRSERSGRGDGRTYIINWVAEFDGGSKLCSSEDAGQSPFTIVVPHDMRGGKDW